MVMRCIVLLWLYRAAICVEIFTSYGAIEVVVSAFVIRQTTTQSKPTFYHLKIVMIWEKILLKLLPWYLGPISMSVL